jgi:NTP pyrophosphatase (non-canonical NTP hydrolase)
MAQEVMMTLNEYQDRADRFAVYGSTPEHYGVPLYPFLALAEETGEVVGKVAKAARKGLPVDGSAVAAELGDVLWQVAACAREIGLTLGDIAAINLAKLGDRSDRGVIVGEGDNR